MRRGKPQQQLYRPGSGPLRKSTGNSDFDTQQSNDGSPNIHAELKSSQSETITPLTNLSIDENNAKKKIKKPEQEFYVPKPVTTQTRENNNESGFNSMPKSAMDGNINGDNNCSNIDKGNNSRNSKNFSRRGQDDDRNDNEKKGRNSRQGSEPRGNARNGNNFNRNRDFRSVEPSINNSQPQNRINRNINSTPNPLKDTTVNTETTQSRYNTTLNKDKPLYIDNKDNNTSYKEMKPYKDPPKEVNEGYGPNRDFQRSTIRENRDCGDHNRDFKEPVPDYKGYGRDRVPRDTRSSNRDFRDFRERDGRGASNKPPSGRRHSTIGVEQNDRLSIDKKQQLVVKMQNLPPRFQRLEQERRAAEAAKHAGHKNATTEERVGAGLTFQGSHPSTSSFHQPHSYLDHGYDNSGFSSMPASMSVNFSSLSASSSSSTSQQYNPVSSTSATASTQANPLMYHTLPNPGKGRGRGRHIPQHIDTSRLFNPRASSESGFSNSASPINSRPTTPLGGGFGPGGGTAAYMVSKQQSHSMNTTDYQPQQKPLLEQSFKPQTTINTSYYHQNKPSGSSGRNQDTSSGYNQQQLTGQQSNLRQTQQNHGNYPQGYQRNQRFNDNRARSTESLNDNTGGYDRGPIREQRKHYGKEIYEHNNKDRYFRSSNNAKQQDSQTYAKSEAKVSEHPNATFPKPKTGEYVSPSLSASDTTESQGSKPFPFKNIFDWSEDVDQENPLYPEADNEASDAALTRSSSMTSLMENSTASLPPSTNNKKKNKRHSNRSSRRRQSQSKDIPDTDGNYQGRYQGEYQQRDNRSRQTEQTFRVPQEPARSRDDHNRRRSGERRMTPEENREIDRRSRERYDSRSFTSRSRDRDPSTEQEPLNWRSEMRNSHSSYESRSRQNSERSRTNSERSNYSVEIVRSGDEKSRGMPRDAQRKPPPDSSTTLTSTKRWDNIDSTTPKQAGVLILNQAPSVPTTVINPPVTSQETSFNRPPVLSNNISTYSGGSSGGVSMRDIGRGGSGVSGRGNSGQKSLFDPNNPSKPIIVNKPVSSTRVNAPGFNEDAEVPQIELTTDQYGNIRPLWYDSDSESFKCARFPALLRDICRADTGLQHILYTGRTLVAWDDVTSYRTFLKSALEYLLCEDLRFAERHNVDQHFWKLLYYNIIEMARKAMGACTAQTREQFRVFLINLIEDGCTFYEGLVGQLEKTHSFKVGHAIAGVANDAKYVGLALISVQKCYIFLGDLQRYKEQVNETGNYGKSRQYYVKAHEINPKNGRPYSQLAVLAVYARRKLDAVYYYMRSLMSSNPVQSSREALISLLDENRKKYEQTERKRREEYLKRQHQRQLMKEKESETIRSAPNSLRKETWIRPDDGKRVHRTTSTVPEKKCIDSDEDDLDNLSSAELNKRFITSYLHVHGKLITRIGMETFHDTAVQMLKEFRVLLQHTPVALPCNRFLQLLALNMFAIDSTELKDKQYEVGYRSEQQERALIVSLQMFNVILTRCVSILHEYVRHTLPSPRSSINAMHPSTSPRDDQQQPVSRSSLSATTPKTSQTTARGAVVRERFLDPATLPQDAQVLLPAVKVWSDWMLCHTNVWNPPPNTQDYNVGNNGNVWNRLAALVNLLQKLDQSLASEFCNDMKDGYFKIRLPEDAILSGFTPLMYHVPIPKYTPNYHDVETAQSVHRVELLTFFGTHFLCGLDPPVLEMVMENDHWVYKSVVTASRPGDGREGGSGCGSSGPSTPPELNDDNDVLLEISDEEDFDLSKKDDNDLTAANDTSIEVRNLLSRKVELEKCHRSQELHRQRVQKILQQSVVSVHIEVKPKYILPDTNCFIDYLDLLKKLVGSNVYTLMVSLVVLGELEGLSKGPGSHQPLTSTPANLQHTLKVSEAAKCALDYITIKHANIKCITTKGTVLSSSTFTAEDDSVAVMKNDDKILATCLCLGSKGNRDQPTGEPRKLFRDVVLLTEDRNLRVKALARDVPVRELPDFIKWAGLG